MTSFFVFIFCLADKPASAVYGFNPRECQNTVFTGPACHFNAKLPCRRRNIRYTVVSKKEIKAVELFCRLSVGRVIFLVRYGEFFALSRSCLTVIRHMTDSVTDASTTNMTRSEDSPMLFRLFSAVLTACAVFQEATLLALVMVIYVFSSSEAVMSRYCMFPVVLSESCILMSPSAYRCDSSDMLSPLL